METVVRVSEPREMLAYIPYRLGFWPSWSVVLVSLQAGDRSARVGLVVRVDLDDLGDESTGAELARSLSTHLRRDGAQGVLTVVYAQLTADELARHGPWQRARANLDAVLGWAQRPAPWTVGPEEYAHLGCTDVRCCAGRGRPVAELGSTQVGAEMVLKGAVVAPSREELGVPRTGGPAVRAAAAAGARKEIARLARLRRADPVGGWPSAGASGARGTPGLVRWRRTGARRWDAARAATADGIPVSAEDHGRLLVHLGDRPLRDAIVTAEMIDPGGAPTSEYLRPERLLAALDAAGVPDRQVLAPALELLRATASRARTGTAAPALGALAFLTWWLGDGARADVLVQQCLAEEPGHRLARIVQEALLIGMPPAWVRQGHARDGSG